MRIELTTDYAIHERTLPEGTQLRVSKSLGKELIDLKVAKALDGFTFEEEIEHIIEVAMENEELPKVKKVTKKKKSNN
tara:strand:- start:237 stop:470 length:234 start_codon:yes stop_codon:yes gene_type:complete